MVATLDPASTGIAGLDDILRGGLPRNRIYLVHGAPGSGKTTLGLQFLLEGRRLGEPCLYVTLSETEEELRAVALSHGWHLDGVALHQLSSLEEMLEARTQNTLFHPAEVELNETIQRVLTLVDKVRPTRVVFDSLSEMRLLAGESLRYRRQILALKQQFAGRKATVMFLDDGSADASDQQLESLAHGVISLDRVSPDYGSIRRRIEVVKLRGVDARGGRHDYNIARGGLEVYPRLIASEHHADFKREQVSSGVATFDALVGGGIDRGTSTLLLGPAGSGKSGIASQYVYSALLRGERAAMFNFDENQGTFLARARGIGTPFEEAIARGQLTVRQVDPAELSPGEFTALVRAAVEQQQARVIVIDSLNGYLMAMPDDRYLLIQMHELLSYLGQLGVTTLLVVAQHGLLGSMHAPVDITYLSDNVVLFRFFEANGQVRKAISVLKKRTGRHEDSIRELRTTARGIEVGPPLSEFRGILSGLPQISSPPPFERNRDT